MEPITIIYNYYNNNNYSYSYYKLFYILLPMDIFNDDDNMTDLNMTDF